MTMGELTEGFLFVITVHTVNDVLPYLYPQHVFCIVFMICILEVYDSEYV